MDPNKERPQAKNSPSDVGARKSQEAPGGWEAEARESRYKDEETERWRTFGAWVRSRRRSLGISQNVAASRAGLAGNHWSRLENGKSGIRRDKVEAIARALELHPSLVFEASGYAPPASRLHSSEPTVRRYRVAKHSSQASQADAGVVVSHPDSSSQAILLTLREDVDRLEGYMVQILDNQRRQEEFAHSMIVVVKGISSLMEGKPAAILRRLLNHRGSRSGTAIRTS